MDNKQFIFFPSFSAGNVGNAMKKKGKLRNGLDIAFYSNDFPEEFRHPFFLTSAGHSYKQKNYMNDFGFNDAKDMLVLGDSGGYQICSGAIKWDPKIVPSIFEWLENNSHIAMNLDIPPRMKYAGKFTEALEISKKNFQYFYEKQTGKTQFLNVLQGDDEDSYKLWHKSVADYEFNGWGVGGATTSIYRMFCALQALLSGKEHLKDNNKYLHILGTSKVLDFFLISQLQKSLNEVGSKMQVTTDSSTPSRGVTYGLYYYGVDFRKASFRSLHIPKDRAENNKEVSKHTDNSLEGSTALLPNLIAFDKHLEGGYVYEDLRDWTIEGYATVVLHNFMFFKDVINKINAYVDGHPYFLEQVTSADTFLLLKAIDEMVKAHANGTTPEKVFAKYKPHFLKMSSSINTLSKSTHSFF